MIKAEEKVYHTSDDPSQLPMMLEGIANWHQEKGFQVTRGSNGSVAIHLQDGEIHFELRGLEIIQTVFLNEQN